MRSCLVMGSGRGGTSTVAGSLRDAGYFMGERLHAGTVSNPKGFFEDEEVNRINEDLLAPVTPRRPNGPLRRLYPSRPGDRQRWLSEVAVGTKLDRPPDIDRRIRALVRREPFCFKDPRFCYTLPVWRPLLPEDTVFVCVFREPGRTANSIVTECRTAPYLRDLRMTRRAALRVWTLMFRHVLDRHRFHGTWVFVHFDQFLTGAALPRLEDALGARLDRSFADAQLVRSIDSGPVPPEARRLYLELCDLAGHDPLDVPQAAGVSRA